MVHCTLPSRSVSLVRRTGASPIFMTQTSFSATNATLCPSGEIAGALMPRTVRDAKLSNCRSFGVVIAGRRTAIDAENGTSVRPLPSALRMRILPSAV